MLVQPTAKQYSCNNYQFKNHNNVPMFKGEFGAKVLKEIEASGATTKEGISKVLAKLGIGTMGLIAISKLKDILESVFAQKQEQDSTQRSKIRELENEKRNLSVELETQKQQIVAREAVLDEKEKSLINVEHLLKQNEIDELKSSMRAFYGIKEPEIKTYDSLGEQCIAVIDIINQSRKGREGYRGVNVSNFNDTNINRLVLTLQNIDKKISSETLDILRKITAMHDYNLDALIQAIKILKDDFGDIDCNKSSYFIALYSLDNASLGSVAMNMAKAFNMKNVTSSNDANLRAAIDYLEKNISNHSILYKHSIELNRFDIEQYSPSAIKDSLSKVKAIMAKMDKNCCSNSRGAYSQLDEFLTKCANY